MFFAKSGRITRSHITARVATLDIVTSLAITTVTGGYIYGFKPINDGFKCVIDGFKPVNVDHCDRSASTVLISKTVDNVSQLCSVTVNALPKDSTLSIVQAPNQSCGEGRDMARG